MATALIMRVGTVGLCVAACLLLAAPARAADDAQAVEVPSGKDQAPKDSKSDPDAAQDSQAHEVPVEDADGASGPSGGFGNTPRSESPQLSTVDDAFVLDDRDDYYGGEVLSELYKQCFHPDYDYEGYSSSDDDFRGAYDYGHNATAESFAEERWKITGEIGFVSGSSTYSNNDSQSWELKEKLRENSGNCYEFYQEYKVDHSYVASGEMVVGAKQKLEKLLWDGGLDLTEEFTQYKDRNDSVNDRQEGLFKLRFDPQWNGGDTRADVEYKYNIKEYETFSPRSYKHNSGKLRLSQKFGDDVNGSITGRFDNYDYSLGSTRGNRRSSIGTDWSYKASDELSFIAGLESEQKTYSVRKTRDYEQLETSVGARYQPDEDTYISGDYRNTDYVGTFNPSNSYNEDSFSAYYQRHLSEKLDANVRLNERRKRFDLDPNDDLNQHTLNAGLNYNPNECWSFSASLGNDEYAYTNPTRAYTRRDYQLGAGYTHCDLRLSSDFSHSTTDYKTLPLQSYDLDCLTTTLDYDLDKSRLSLCLTLSKLDQADPASFNDYDETAFSGSWEYEIDPETDLTLRYDSSKRSYDAQPGITDNTFEATLSFEL